MDMLLPPPKNKYYPKHGGMLTNSHSARRRPETTSALALLPKGGNKQGPSTNANGTLVIRKGSDGATLDTSLISRVGRRADEIVYDTHSALVERNVGRDHLARPGAEEEDAVAAKTAAALGQLISGKVDAARPLTVQSKGDEASHSTFINYRPVQAGAVKQRVIRLVQEQVDPMEPPRHKHRKNPGGGAEPPAPVLHSPPRKLTAEDQANWNIPPVVSNAKNSRGFTIALDKRLAADGRGLIKEEVNDRHAHLAEALFIAERKAREEVNLRNTLKARLAEEERLREEEKLAKLAADARAQRAGAAVETSQEGLMSEEGAATPGGDASVDAAALREREEMRREQRRQLDRTLHTDEAGNVVSRKRDADRDISEKIALGMGIGKRKAEVQYDERLFNQTGGIGSGLLQDGEAQVYDKDLFSKRSDVLSHRPSQAAMSSYGGQSAEQAYEELQSKAKRFRADPEFVGESSGRQNGVPVKFEKVAPSAQPSNGPSQDGFGLMFPSSSGASRKTLSGVGNGIRGGTMLAAAGASSRDQLMGSRGGMSTSLNSKFRHATK